MPSITNVTPKQAASFINGLGWSFIALSVLSMLLAAVQYTLFAHLIPPEPLRAAIADAVYLKLLPPSALTVLRHVPAIALALFALGAVTLLVSIALLKRKPWARTVFAWTMIATAILHVAGLLLPFYIARDFSAALDEMPLDIRAFASTMATLLSIISMVMGVVFACAFAWVAKQLFAVDIVREFVSRDDAAGS